MKRKAALSKAQQWARERFLMKGHIKLAIDNFEAMILSPTTLPQEMRCLSLAVNHLQAIMKDIDKNSKESKAQYMRINNE